MPSQTPVYALPYPLGGELVKYGDDAIKALAERVEALLPTIPGFRNVIRNGDFSIAQRGNGPFGTSGQYGIDGYQFYVSGACAGNIVRTNLPAASAPNRYSVSVQLATAASSAGDYEFINIPIEDVRTLAGRTVTISFKANANIAGRALGVSVRQNFGTGGSPSALVDTAIGNVVLTATSTGYALTFVMPSIALKTIGTNEDSALHIRFWLATGSTQLPNSGFSTAGQGTQAAWTLTLLDIQLEAGIAATPFERLPQALQMNWCRRYYQRYDSTGSVLGHFASGIAVSATIIYFGWRHEPPMCGTLPPAITWSGVGSSDGVVANKPATVVAWYAGYANNQHGLLSVTVASGGTGHWPELLSITTTGYLAFSAELT